MRKTHILPLVLPIQRQVRHAPQDFCGQVCRPTPFKNSHRDIRRQPYSGLYTARFDVTEQLLEARANHCSSREPAIVITIGEFGPLLILLAKDIGRTDLALRIQ